MRCPDCNKFVSFDEGNVDDIDVVIDDNGVICVSGRVVLPCAECGTELKELNVEDEYDTTEDFATNNETAVRSIVSKQHHHLLTDKWFEKMSVEYIMDEPNIEFTERVQTHTIKRTKKGIKEVPIKNSRYAKSYKGVCVSGEVVRKITFPEFDEDGSESKTHAEIEDTARFEITIEEQASAFDEIC